MIGLSILSGPTSTWFLTCWRTWRRWASTCRSCSAGSFPEEDRQRLIDLGIAAIYTPKDFQIAKIMRDVAELAVRHRGES